MTEQASTGTATIHRLRALTVALDLLGSEFAQKHALHPTDIRALIALLDADRSGHRATPGWLGTELGLNSASVTALIDRMHTRDLVRREPDSTDRRRVILRVTEHATELGTAFFGPVITRAVEALEQFSPDQMVTITSFLEAMSAVVGSVRNDQSR